MSDFRRDAQIALIQATEALLHPGDDDLAQAILYVCIALSYLKKSDRGCVAQDRALVLLQQLKTKREGTP